jgi:hypothetical protein
MRFMFIGGYPKGYDNPFAPETRSGFIPRNTGKELKIDALYFDIWKNAKEENDGVVSRETCEHLKSQQDECI